MANKFREKKPAPEEEPEWKAPAEEEQPDTEVPAGEEQSDSGSDASADGREPIVGRVLGGDVLASRWARRQVPLLLLCLVYLLLIVGNRYRVERLSREKNAAAQRVEHLREQRILLQERYQQSVKISQIAEDLKEVGVGITAGPPYEIED